MRAPALILFASLVILAAGCSVPESGGLAADLEQAGTMVITGVGEDEAGPVFIRHEIDSTFTNGYQIVAADVDSDGFTDLVALSTDPPQLAWYESPRWIRHDIDIDGERHIDVAPADVDGDGDMDLAVAGAFFLDQSTRGGSIVWLENLQDAPGMRPEWRTHRIDAIPTAHRLQWADLDWDGRMELVVLPLLGPGSTPLEMEAPVPFIAYRVPENPVADSWSRITIDSTLHLAHGMEVVDWDGEGGEDLIVASAEGVTLYLSQVVDGMLEFPKRRVTANSGPNASPGAGEVASCPQGARRVVSAVEPWHGEQLVLYREPSEISQATYWPRTVIDTTFSDGHALTCVDFDRDGHDEIIAGYRGPGHNLFFYGFDPEAETWSRWALDEGGMSASGVEVADLNKDGWPDLAAVGSSTNNVVWYEFVRTGRQVIDNEP